LFVNTEYGYFIEHNQRLFMLYGENVLPEETGQMPARFALPPAI
jgi:hypothetical protein